MSVPFAIKLDESLAEGFCRQLMTFARRSAVREESVLLLGRAARAVSRVTSMGHVCLLLTELLETDDEAILRQARADLFASGLVANEQEQTPLPLVLDSDGRLYLGRYFEYERRLAAMLMARATAVPARVETDPADAERLGLVFISKEESGTERVDWQRLAAAMAIRNRLTIITGGPGTGKTTTVVNLLACLLAGNPELRIALAAPTGKAAQRMQDAIRERAGHLPENLRSLLPAESYTIHRLLGVMPDSQSFRHNAANPLALDVLIVDEASMLDLALAMKLVAAMPEAARLIFLGDKDQLAAVEAGAVFSEISSDPTISEPCRQQLASLSGLPVEVIRPPAVGKRSPLQDAVIWLNDNYRFGTQSGIGQLAQAINRQDVEAALTCLRSDGDGGVRWVEDGGAQLAQQALAELLAGFDDYLGSVREQDSNPAAVFAALGRFRILCAVRDSERGVDWLNSYISKSFRQRLDHGLDDGRTPWYPGRPLMVLKNDYVLKLFNGDIGIILPSADGRLMACFPTDDGRSRALAPARLPPHETAFAMTVHKAQGSEFEQVAFVLPAYSSPVLTKELVYTAVTRTRRTVHLYGSAVVLSEAIQKQSIRHSGLISRMRSG